MASNAYILVEVSTLIVYGLYFGLLDSPWRQVKVKQMPYYVVYLMLVADKYDSPSSSLIDPFLVYFF